MEHKLQRRGINLHRQSNINKPHNPIVITPAIPAAYPSVPPQSKTECTSTAYIHILNLAGPNNRPFLTSNVDAEVSRLYQKFVLIKYAVQCCTMLHYSAIKTTRTGQPANVLRPWNVNMERSKLS